MTPQEKKIISLRKQLAKITATKQSDTNIVYEVRGLVSKLGKQFTTLQKDYKALVASHPAATNEKFEAKSKKINTAYNGILDALRPVDQRVREGVRRDAEARQQHVRQERPVHRPGIVAQRRDMPPPVAPEGGFRWRPGIYAPPPAAQHQVVNALRAAPRRWVPQAGVEVPQPVGAGQAIAAMQAGQARANAQAADRPMVHDNFDEDFGEVV